MLVLLWLIKKRGVMLSGVLIFIVLVFIIWFDYNYIKDDDDKKED